MTADEDRHRALSRIDAAVGEYYVVDDALMDAMAYAMECGVPEDEIVGRVTVYTPPDVPTALAILGRMNRAGQLLADGGIGVSTPDENDEVWLHTVSAPRRGVVLQHVEENLADSGDPGTPERAALAERVAAKVVPCLYDAGFELASDTATLARAQAQAAFGEPDARLWLEESPRS